MRTDGTAVLLETDSGDQYPGTFISAARRGATIRASLEVDGSIWSRLRAAHGFHCSPSALGPHTVDVAPDVIATLDLQLAPALTPGLLAVDPTVAVVGALLAAPEPTVLRRCASWYLRACTVPMELDGVELGPGESVNEGFRTAWGARPDHDELGIVGFVAEHLDRRGWSVSPLDGVAGFTWHLTGTHTGWNATVLVDDDARRCTIYSVLAAVVPDTRRSDACDRVNRLNVGQVAGSWEVTDRGSVRMRSAVELGGTPAPDEAIALTIDRHLDTFDEVVAEVLDLLGD